MFLEITRVWMNFAGGCNGGEKFRKVVRLRSRRRRREQRRVKRAPQSAPNERRRRANRGAKGARAAAGGRHINTFREKM